MRQSLFTSIYKGIIPLNLMHTFHVEVSGARNPIGMDENPIESVFGARFSEAGSLLLFPLIGVQVNPGDSTTLIADMLSELSSPRSSRMLCDDDEDSPSGITMVLDRLAWRGWRAELDEESTRCMIGEEDL